MRLVRETIALERLRVPQRLENEFSLAWQESLDSRLGLIDSQNGVLQTESHRGPDTLSSHCPIFFSHEKWNSNEFLKSEILHTAFLSAEDAHRLMLSSYLSDSGVTMTAVSERLAFSCSSTVVTLPILELRKLMLVKLDVGGDIEKDKSAEIEERHG